MVFISLHWKKNGDGFIQNNFHSEIGKFHK